MLSVCPGEGGIALSCVHREGGSPPLLEQCWFEPTPPSADRGDALTKLVKSRRLDRYTCTSIMELGTYNLLLVEQPDVPPAELRAATRWRVKDLIDYHVDDAVIDVFEVSDHQTAGRNRLMYAVVAKSQVVKQKIDMLLDAGLRLATVDIPELCMRNVATLLPEDVSGVGLIYLVRGGGLITLTHQGRLYLSRLIDPPRASRAGAAASDARDDAAQAWLDSIVIEIQRSMDYYESHFGQPPIGNLVIAPMERELRGVEAYLSEQLAIGVRRLDLNAVIDTREEVGAELQFRCWLAIGAALRVESKAL